MPASEFPSVASVEVIPTQPKPADVRNIEHIAATEKVSLGSVAYVVKINLERSLPATSLGFELYLDDYRVRKYWAFKGGIYFKVYNPRFFAKHGGKQLRFCLAGKDCRDTGVRLPPTTPLAPASDKARAATAATSSLPTQDEVLNQ